MMVKAIWNGEVIAESRDVKKMEGVVYFPARSVKMEYLRTDPTYKATTEKGKITYFDLVVHGEINNDAAYSYIEPSESGMFIKDYIAFRRGVSLTEESLER